MGFRDVDSGTWDSGTQGLGTQRMWGLGEVGTRWLGDVIEKQHLIFKLNVSNQETMIIVSW